MNTSLNQTPIHILTLLSILTSTPCVVLSCVTIALSVSHSSPTPINVQSSPGLLLAYIPFLYLLTLIFHAGVYWAFRNYPLAVEAGEELGKKKWICGIWTIAVGWIGALSIGIVTWTMEFHKSRGNSTHLPLFIAPTILSLIQCCVMIALGVIFYQHRRRVVYASKWAWRVEPGRGATGGRGWR